MKEFLNLITAYDYELCENKVLNVQCFFIKKKDAADRAMARSS